MHPKNIFAGAPELKHRVTPSLGLRVDGMVQDSPQNWMLE
jgi:hypothetical protein